MASGMPAAGANVCRHVYCVALLIMAITLKGVCGKTVLYNNSGRDLALIIPQQQKGVMTSMEVPSGHSVELEGAQQQTGLMIQDVKSGAEAGPFDIPDHRSIEAFSFDPSTSAATTSFGNLLNVLLNVGNLLNVGLRMGG